MIYKRSSPRALSMEYPWLRNLVTMNWRLFATSSLATSRIVVISVILLSMTPSKNGSSLQAGKKLVKSTLNHRESSYQILK